MPLLVDIIRHINPCEKTSRFKDIPNLCSQENFRKTIETERARVDRNGHCFSVVSFKLATETKNGQLRNNLLDVLKKRLRSTDEIGLIDEDHIGVLLHDTPPDSAYYFTNYIQKKIGSEFSEFDYDIYTYPIDKDNNNLNHNNSLIGTYKYSDRRDKKNGKKLQRNFDVTNSDLNSKKKFCHSNIDAICNPIHITKDINPLLYQRIPAWKRLIDIIGAVSGIVFLSPLFLIIAFLIKITSPGPVFFKQERIGCNGKPFTFWKFRTMAHNLDTTKHQRYLATLINESDDKPMAKIDNELQLIPFGKLLRKSCLDELPQLYNVLRGEMSLVGPRPPIPYEVIEYKPWHKRRLNTIPGMTGLWQVSGKNRLSFLEMVRLDIRYTKHINVLSEIKILLMTPISIIAQVVNGRERVKM